jgi:hypothetical protein
MEFYSKYELIDPLPGEGTRSFRARQVRTGREVTVHLLPGGGNPESEALLARLRALPPRSMSKLIEVGDNEGTTYVATDAPPFLHLAEWLGEQERAAREDASRYTRAGSWKIPVQPPASAPAPPAPVPAPVVPPAPVAEPGEFTRMFQQGAPLATGQTPAAPTPAVPPIAAPNAEQLAATVEMPAMRKAFLEAVEAPPAREANVTPPATPPVAAPPVAAPPPAGEFTRLFQAPGAPAVTGQMPVAPAPPPPAQAPSPAGPGEFTRLFQSPLPHAPAQGDWPAQAPAAPPPGEFTRMFQSGPGAAPGLGANPIPPAPQQERQAGEFTRFFQSPGPASTPASPPSSPFGPVSPPASPSAPGGFTQMFGKPGAMPPGSLGAPVSAPPAAPPPPPSTMGPRAAGSATQAFSIPAPAPASTPLRAGVPQPPPVPQGPSEYTRMISLGSAGTASGPGAMPLPGPGGAPGAPQFQMPQMPQMPVAPQMPQMPVMPQAPPMPQFQAPQAPPVQAPPAKAPASNTLLIAIFCVLAFLAGVVVMVLVMKK